jgi:hypothetical protein
MGRITENVFPNAGTERSDEDCGDRRKLRLKRAGSLGVHLFSGFGPLSEARAVFKEGIAVQFYCCHSLPVQVILAVLTLRPLATRVCNNSTPPSKDTQILQVKEFLHSCLL